MAKFARSAHLRLLADWIDGKFPDDPNPEVQSNLRDFADSFERLEELIFHGRQRAEADLASGDATRQLVGKLWLVWIAMIEQAMDGEH